MPKIHNACVSRRTERPTRTLVCPPVISCMAKEKSQMTTGASHSQGLFVATFPIYFLIHKYSQRAVHICCMLPCIVMHEQSEERIIVQWWIIRVMWWDLEEPGPAVFDPWCFQLKVLKWKVMWKMGVRNWGKWLPVPTWVDSAASALLV